MGRGKPRHQPKQWPARQPCELALLDVLEGEDQPLSQALFCFPSLEHAQRSVLIMCSTGKIRLLSNDGSEDEPIPEWRVRQILDDAANWERSDSPRFRLSLVLSPP